MGFCASNAEWKHIQHCCELFLYHGTWGPSSYRDLGNQRETKGVFVASSIKTNQNLSWRKHLRNSPAAKGDFISFFASTHSPIMELKYGVGPGNNLHQNKRTRIFAHQYKLNKRHTKHHKEFHEQRNILCTQQAKKLPFCVMPCSPTVIQNVWSIT